jgi:2-polyprenyl-3-methyl-5-hydroxy-6-metoxy-1,4-benzoquinol methylase
MTEKDYYERYWRNQFGSDQRNKCKNFEEEPSRWNESSLQIVLSFCSGMLKGKVLDAGCGDGFFSNQLTFFDEVKDITGIDISEKAIEMALEKYPKIQFRQASLNKIPFESASFDSIVMVEVIEHLVDIDGTLEDLSRVLKPGGLLLITTTDFNWLKAVIIAMFYFEKYFYPTNPHVRFFTKSTLTEVLLAHGFKVIKYSWNGSYLGLMPKGQMVLARKNKN